MQVLRGVVSACEEQASFLVNVKSLFYSVRQPVRENERDTRRGRSVVKWRETGDEGLRTGDRRKLFLATKRVSFPSSSHGSINDIIDRSPFSNIFHHDPLKLLFPPFEQRGGKISPGHARQSAQTRRNKRYYTRRIVGYQIIKVRGDRFPAIRSTASFKLL